MYIPREKLCRMSPNIHPFMSASRSATNKTLIMSSNGHRKIVWNYDGYNIVG